jgi:hypothetical protein
MLNRSNDEQLLAVIGINLPEIINKIHNTNESIRNLSSVTHQLKLEITGLVDVINRFSKSSDKQSNRIFWLTIVIAITSFLNVAAVIFQTLYKS